MPQSVIYNDYKSSLKHFINKDFKRSYDLITRLHECCYRNFERNIISEDLFIKIINLYLTQIGVLLSPLENPNEFRLSTPERKSLTKSIKQNEFWNRLKLFYKDVDRVPVKLIYQVFLLTYTCENGSQTPELVAVVRQFAEVYSSLDFKAASYSDEEYLKRFVELYIFKVLTDAGDFDTALRLLQENHLLDSVPSEKRLETIKQEQLRKEESKKKAAAVKELRDRARKIAEAELRKKEKQEANLRYRSLKQIKQAREKELSDENNQSIELSHKSLTMSPIERWVWKVKYLIQFSNNFVQKNYIALLLVLVIAFVLRRLKRAKNLNLLTKFQETVKMAFKVTYL